jgi:pimeloyl-ACP methyl ester carboxylesterase
VTQFIEANGRRYGCDLRGAGPNLVLLHAGICNRHMYDPLVEAFESDFRILNYDQASFGDSPAPPDPISPVHDLFGLMDAAGMPEAVLVATSFGTRVAFDATLANPQRVRAVVAAGPGLSGRAASDSMVALNAEVDGAIDAGDLTLANELEMRIWLDGVGRRDPVDPGVRNTVAAMNYVLLQDAVAGAELSELPPRRPATENLTSIRCPVLLVVGEYDQPHVRDTARMIAEQAPAANLVTVPATAHLPSLERPKFFNELLRDFLVSLS